MDDTQDSSTSSILTPRQTLFVVLGLLLGVLLEAIDSTIVNNTMPAIVEKLGGTPQMQSWVISAYLLMMTMTTPIYGRLSDLYGRMPFYLGGMILFMLGSLLSGASHSISQLIIFRGMQGLGAGAMMPIAVAIGQTLFPAEKRGKFQGAVSGAFALASIFGPILGGLIVKKLNWRWLFYLNLPFGVLALLILYTFLPPSVRKSSSSAHAPKIDYLGAVLLSTFTASFMLFFTLGSDSEAGFLSIKSIGCLMIAVFSMLFFILVERRAEQPIVPFELFKNTTFMLSVSSVFSLGGIMFAMVVYIPQYFQFVKAYTPSYSGALMTPMMICMVSGSLFSGRSLGRIIYRYKLLALTAASFLLIAMFSCIFFRSGTPLPFIIVAMCLFGFGMGVTFPLYGIVIANSIDKQMIGSAFGVLAFFRHMGATIFTAVFGAIYGTRLGFELKKQLGSFLPSLGGDYFSVKHLVGKEALHHIQTTLTKLGMSPQLAIRILASHRVAVERSIPVVFMAALMVAFILLFLSLYLTDKKIIFGQKNASPQGK